MNVLIICSILGMIMQDGTGHDLTQRAENSQSQRLFEYRGTLCDREAAWRQLEQTGHDVPTITETSNESHVYTPILISLYHIIFHYIELYDIILHCIMLTMQ